MGQHQNGGVAHSAFSANFAHRSASSGCTCLEVIRLFAKQYAGYTVISLSEGYDLLQLLCVTFDFFFLRDYSTPDMLELVL